MSDVKFHPLNDRVLVRRVESEAKSAGGLFIPDTAKERPIQGEVVAVGSGKLLDNGTRRAPAVKVGDRILFGKYAGDEIKLAGEEHLILREDEVLGVVE